MYAVEEKLDFTRQGFQAGAMACIGLAAGVAAYGVLFGVLAVQAGMTPMQALFMSMTVFAGASQFVALDMWGEQLPVAALVVTTFVVNMRHILMSAATMPWLKHVGGVPAYASVFFMADENWAMAMSYWDKHKNNGAYMMGAGCMLYLFWNTATIIGATVAGTITDPAEYGIDFAFCAAFLSLLTGMYKGKSDIVCWSVAGLTALAVSTLVPGKWYILAGGIAGGLVGVLQYERR